jgi:hypothetical protein
MRGSFQHFAYARYLIQSHAKHYALIVEKTLSGGVALPRSRSGYMSVALFLRTSTRGVAALQLFQ